MRLAALGITVTLGMMLVALTAGHSHPRIALAACQEPHLFGDEWPDNKVDTTDATIVLRFAADIQPEPDFACPYDDVNCDGQMNAADSLVILAYVADTGYRSLQHQPCLELGQPDHPPLSSDSPSPSPDY